MFEADEKRLKIKEAVLKWFGTFNRGDLILYKDIEKIVGLKHQEDRFRAITDWARKQHQEQRGITILAEASIGFRLLTTTEQLAEMSRREKRIRTQRRLGTKSTAVLPDEELTEHERSKRNHQLYLADRARSESNHRMRLLAYLNRSKPGEPLKVRWREDEEEKTG